MNAALNKAEGEDGMSEEASREQVPMQVTNTIGYGIRDLQPYGYGPY